MLKKMDSITSFFLELDALKLVKRRSYIHGGERLENSAEHSWHLAMACWAINHHFNLDLSDEKLLKLALIHDLGEIDAGDTFLYATGRDSAHEAERKCVRRLAEHGGNTIPDLPELLEEQETGKSRETKLLKVVVRLLPFLLNISTEGKTWQGLGVKKSQVVQAHAFIESEFPQIHEWMMEMVEKAVSEGWLADR